MSSPVFDLPGWLRRIGYVGTLEPTLGTLHGLIHAHSHAIAYESLDIMLGRTPRLDLASLQAKLIAFVPEDPTCAAHSVLLARRALGMTLAIRPGGPGLRSRPRRPF
jgi:hypothetical protein